MMKKSTATAILFLVSCGFFIYHTAITENVSSQVFWGVLLLLNYINDKHQETKDHMEETSYLDD